MITTSEISNIVKANDIAAEIRTLNDMQDTLLTPILDRVIATNDLNEMRLLLNMLPAGFHRSELRTLINTKAL